MAVVKAQYIKQNRKARSLAKATIRYIQHRPDRDGQRIWRSLFGNDGVMERSDAYSMLDAAPKGSVLWRIIFSPDPEGEDKPRDLNLVEATEKLMQFTFGVRFEKQVQWVAAVHADHRPHRHVYILAMVPERLSRHDFSALPQILRYEATQACLAQRQELDLLRDRTAEQTRAKSDLARGREEPEDNREEGLVRQIGRSK